MGAIGRILKRKAFPKPNTFIGGLGLNYPTSTSGITGQLGVTAISLKRYRSDGPDNEVSFYKRHDYGIAALNAFAGTEVTYYYDEGEKCSINSNQGVFRNTKIYRFWIPRTKLWQGPSGYVTLNNVQTRGYLYLPYWTGEGNNQNYIWNSASVTNKLDILYAPKLTRLTLQLQARRNFVNQTLIRRVVFPRIKTLNANHESYIFTNVNPACIFYLSKEMSYYNQGNENKHVTYWRNRGCEIRWVENMLVPNPVNDLAVNQGTTTAELVFSIPSVNVNSIEGYEIWIHDINTTGYDRWQKYMPHSEALGSGHIITGLQQGTTYIVKLKTFDYYYNLSEFSNEIQFTTNIIGLLQGTINGTSSMTVNT
jgi:hypothetical protein